MSEKIINEITMEIKAINDNFPDLKLGNFIQLAIDEEFKRLNVDIAEVSNKKILLALQRFNLNTKNKRLKNGN